MQSWPNLSRLLPDIHLEGLGKTTENLSQDSRPPGRNLNVGLSNTKQECEPLGHDVLSRYGRLLCKYCPAVSGSVVISINTKRSKLGNLSQKF
jgi:hypothetical protein